MKLQILQHLSKKFPKNLLKDSYLIACQHILPSTYYMIQSLVDLGISPEKVALFGKCYSTSNLAREMMMKEGIYVATESSFFDSHLSFDSYFREKLEAFFLNTIRSWDLDPSYPLIILDDGGELINLANTYLSNNQIAFGVEQTTSGYDKLKNKQLNFPVINVARSDAKLMLESPMIAEAQVSRIIEIIEKLDFPIKNQLIIGNGCIGQSLAQKLTTFCSKVTRYDRIGARTDLSKKELDLNNYDLIIGTTGKTILPFNAHKYLNNQVTLISASSSDREFDAAYLRRRVEKVSDCHKDITIDGIHLPNCGFPINFRGKDEDSVPLDKIQLTIALLFGGICQSVSDKPTQKSFVHLDKSLQQFIVGIFKRINPKKLFI